MNGFIVLLFYCFIADYQLVIGELLDKIAI